MADRADTQAQRTLTELGQPRFRWPRFGLIAAVLLIAVICVVLSLVEPRWTWRAPEPRAVETEGAPLLVSAPFGTVMASAFIKVQTGMGDRDDLFYCTIVPTVTCSNLTQSPAITEVWPVLDGNAQRAAYYGVGSGGVDLYVLALPDGMALPLTVHAGMSGLHTDFEITPAVAATFSPGGEWLAFLAQHKDNDTVELFTARDDGQQVLRITGLGQVVRNYAWLDTHTLAIAAQQSDGELNFWIARLEQDKVELEPIR